MVLLDRALENSKDSFSSGEFIAKLSSLVRLITDSQNAVSTDDLTSYYSEGLLSISTSVNIESFVPSELSPTRPARLPSPSRELLFVFLEGSDSTI